MQFSADNELSLLPTGQSDCKQLIRFGMNRSIDVVILMH